MSGITIITAVQLSLLVSLAGAYDNLMIPPGKSQLASWWSHVVRPVNERGPRIDPDLAAAEKGARVVTVRQDGKGNFRTVTEAVQSVPVGNTRRVVINIGPGEYREKVTIDSSKKFVTLYGNPRAMPVLTYSGTALQYGTVGSGTLMALADYFVGANLIIKNSAPQPDGIRKGAQATALRVSGDKSALYNCKIIGFQDTLCDDRGNHLYKDCYIEGIVDFIFGSGTSLFLNTELHVVGPPGMSVIAAQARESNTENTGYSFVHCSITGGTGQTYLGRAWQSCPRVVYAYSDLGNAILPYGWSDNFHPERRRTVFYGEYKNVGIGSKVVGRAKFSKELTPAQAKPFVSLAFINATTWLLPPPSL